MTTDDCAPRRLTPAEVQAIIDRLAALIRELPPDRQHQFKEFLNDQTHRENAADGPAEGSGDPNG